jgi:Amt family ammonium transporter
MENPIDFGDTAWVLTCAALVLFMTPGLAIFYAGMVTARNTLVMLQQNFIAIGVISLTWVLLGFSLAYSDDAGAGIIGDWALFGLRDIGVPPAPNDHLVAPGITIPTLAFVTYQMMFAIITPALATGAVAGRLRFAGWALFLAVWSLAVYPVIVHWIWHPNGWLADFGAQDWAGGLVVHTTAGAAAAALLLVLGRRVNWPKTNVLPASLPLTILGAGILWFGWFGFNGGDGLQADGIAAQAVLNTQVAGAAGMLAWLLVERLAEGHATVLGGVSGAVAGLATITPCAGYVSTLSSIAIGIIAGLVCHTATRLKFLLRYDDALDVIAVHFVGGALGTLLLGFFGESTINPLGRDGVFFGGGGRLLGAQAAALASVAAYAFVVSWVLAVLVQKTIGLRAARADEQDLDRVQQGLSAYHLGTVHNLPGAGGSRTAPSSRRARRNRPPLATPVRHSAKVVIGYVDAAHVRVDELTDALRRVGAISIAVSESHLHTGRPRIEMFRGYQRNVELTEQLRVEILTPEERIPEVMTVLEKHDPAPIPAFIQSPEIRSLGTHAEAREISKSTDQYGSTGHHEPGADLSSPPPVNGPDTPGRPPETPPDA